MWVKVGQSPHLKDEHAGQHVTLTISFEIICSLSGRIFLKVRLNIPKGDLFDLIITKFSVCQTFVSLRGISDLSISPIPQ